MAEQTSNPNRPLLVLMLFELLKRHPLSLYCLLSLRLNLLFPFRAISSVRAWSLNSWLLLCCLDRRHLLPIFESSSGMVPTLSSEGVLHSRRVFKVLVTIHTKCKLQTADTLFIEESIF